MGAKASPGQLREKAIAALKKLGGKVYRDETEPDKPVLGVDLDNTPATDEALALLELFPDLQMLSLDETQSDSTTPVLLIWQSSPD